MRKATITAALAAASILALSACKQQPATNESASTETPAAAGDINGTWQADLDSVKFDQKPDEFLLQGGQYSCKSCVPSYTVAADGVSHAVSLPYADEIAVKIRFGLLGSRTISASPDSKAIGRRGAIPMMPGRLVSEPR